MGLSEKLFLAYMIKKFPIFYRLDGSGFESC